MIVAPQGDNYGPADAAEVRDDFRLFGAVFPNASIIASTLGDFFDLIEGDPKLRSELPVLKSEVGDTWMCESPRRMGLCLASSHLSAVVAWPVGSPHRRRS